MPKYLVTWKEIHRAEAEVEAASPEEALEKIDRGGWQPDYSDFETIDYGDGPEAVEVRNDS